jgi:hypothetical protein
VYLHEEGADAHCKTWELPGPLPSKLHPTLEAPFSQIYNEPEPTQHPSKISSETKTWRRKHLLESGLGAEPMLEWEYGYMTGAEEEAMEAGYAGFFDKLMHELCGEAVPQASGLIHIIRVPTYK